MRVVFGSTTKGAVIVWTLLPPLISTFIFRSMVLMVTGFSSHGKTSIAPIRFSNGLKTTTERRELITTFYAAGQDTEVENCGCTSITFSGQPSKRAQNLNPRMAIVGSTFYTLNGEPITMEQLLPLDDLKTVAIVVFLRSFGCPFCQELLLKYSRGESSKILTEFNNIKLIVIGIGKPSVGKELMEHLQIPNGDQFVFADPENTLYDRLDLNRGVPSTFFNIATPLALGDRLLKGDTKELGEVLQKWNKGTQGIFFDVSFCDSR